MTDKKTFGAFIKSKRIEKNYSQKELAEMLFVTEGAVSKWERGASYPDITLISDICRVLDVSEHELITASNDLDARKTKQEARKFRVIRNTWIMTPTIAYIIALITCFICNIAVNHTLSWFFIVLTSLICAYTFVPTVTHFFTSKKLTVFTVSTYLSIALLLFTCALYTNGMNWFLTACVGVLMGYVAVFLPILLAKSKVSRYKFLITFVLLEILTFLLVFNINLWKPFMLKSAILITFYAFAPLVISALICTFRFDAFLKTGICVMISTIICYFAEYFVDILFGGETGNYQVNFNDWVNCIEGNIYLLVLLFGLLVSVVFFAIGILRLSKMKVKK